MERGRGSGSGRGGRGGGRGRMGGSKAAGPDGFCVCPNCSNKVKHTVGKPCFEMKCPKCGTQMVRE